MHLPYFGLGLYTDQILKESLKAEKDDNKCIVSGDLKRTLL